MRFIVDENVPPKIKRFLIEKGFDVVDVWDTGLEGKSDDQIMAYARQEKRAVVTFDKHFSDIVKYPPNLHYGVIRIRIHPPILSDIIWSLESFFSHFGKQNLRKTLVVLEKSGYRIRR